MLRKLYEVENLRGLLPFVRGVYSQPSTYHWQDEDGTRRVIRQCEGGEQGDSLMPLLFCLAVHDVLAEVKEQLQDGEVIFAFLDDVYVLCALERARHIYDLFAEKLLQVAGIRLHTEKTRTWNKVGEVPNRMEELGPSVWSFAGVKILVSTVGTDAFYLEAAVKIAAECGATATSTTTSATNTDGCVGPAANEGTCIHTGDSACMECADLTQFCSYDFVRAKCVCSCSS